MYVTATTALCQISSLSRLSFSFYFHFPTIMPSVNFRGKTHGKKESGIKEGKVRTDRNGNILSTSKTRSQTRPPTEDQYDAVPFYQFNVIFVYLILIHQYHAGVTRPPETKLKLKITHKRSSHWGSLVTRCGNGKRKSKEKITSKVYEKKNQSVDKIKN